jgi:hypothetical protein
MGKYLVFRVTDNLLNEDNSKGRFLPQKAWSDLGLEAIPDWFEVDIAFGDITESYVMTAGNGNTSLHFAPRKKMRQWLVKNLNVNDFYFVEPTIVDGMPTLLRIHLAQDLGFEIKLILNNNSNHMFRPYFHHEQSYSGIVERESHHE